MSKRFREYGLALSMLAISLLLAILLLGQWIHYRHVRAEMNRRVTEKVEVRMKPQALEPAHLRLPELDEYAATVERPLFMETRKPVVADEKAEVPAVEKTPLSLKLNGIVASAGTQVGLFTDDRGKFKRLHVNGVVGGWTVAEIKADKVVMEQDGIKEELRLFKPKPKKPQNVNARGAGNPFGQPQSPQTPQSAPPFGQPNEAGNPEEPMDPGQSIPNETSDETAAPTDEPPNDQ